MLALGIRYLTGFVAACDPSHRERVEWPPHPGRVFMAMAATYFQTGEEQEEREALRWLESLRDAPEIHSSDVDARAVVTHYVPVNDKAGPSKALLQSVGVTRDRQPRTFARAWLEKDVVFLVWHRAEPDPTIKGGLAALCSKVSRIGHSSSLVQMWLPVPEEILAPTWVPDDQRAVIHLRMARPGTLDHLSRRYNGNAVKTFGDLQLVARTGDKKAQRAARKRLKDEFANEVPVQLRPELSRFQGYARPVERERHEPATTCFSPQLIIATLVAKETPYRHLDLTCTLAISQRWREALLSHSNDLSDSVRSILSGHSADRGRLDRPHLALVPLAFVGRQHADGHLLGMGLALPSLEREQRRELMLAIHRVSELVLGRLGRWQVEVNTSLNPPVALDTNTWTAHPTGATHWSSVTPVVFDRHPKARDRASYQTEVADMIAHGCKRVGLSAPREVIVTHVSAHLGVPPSHAFPRLQRKDGSERRHSHAIVVFDEPVRGPLIIGAGRYRGHGLFRPLSMPGASRS